MDFLWLLLTSVQWMCSVCCCINGGQQTDSKLSAVLLGVMLEIDWFCLTKLTAALCWLAKIARFCARKLIERCERKSIKLTAVWSASWLSSRHIKQATFTATAWLAFFWKPIWEPIFELPQIPINHSKIKLAQRLNKARVTRAQTSTSLLD